MYSTYDVKTGFYHPPIFCHNEGHAARVFASAFRDQNTTFGLFPEDYQMHHIGEFDDQTGKIISIDPKFCFSGADLKILLHMETKKNDDRINTANRSIEGSSEKVHRLEARK